MSAAPTGHLAGDPVEVQHSTLGDSVLCDDVPVELHRVIHNGGELPNHEIDIRDPGSIGLLSVTQGNLQDALSDS